MHNKKHLKTLVSGLALMMWACPQAFADNEIICPAGTASGSTCWKCGDNCTATLDSTGKMTVSGSGNMYDYFYTGSGENILTTAPWKSQVENITSIDVKGISKIGYAVFAGLSNVTDVTMDNELKSINNTAFYKMPKVTQLIIPESVTSIGSWILGGMPNLKTLVFPENISFGEGGGYWRENVYCTAQMSRCPSNAIIYEKKNGLYYIYDSEGNISEIYTSFLDFNNNVIKEKTMRNSQKDENGDILQYDNNGNVVAKYDSNGALLNSYLYEEDGTVFSYDANGQLVSARKNSAFTPAQASALAKNGNVNTVTLTFK